MDGSETVISTCAVGSCSVMSRGCARRCTRVGVPGWVYREGIREGYTGVVPSHRKAEGMYSEAGPEGLQGLEWWYIPAARPAPADHPLHTPAGCSGARSAVSWDLLENARLLANKARFDLILLKLSQNRQVSPKYAQKASHSPYFQNGLKKSPLDFPRFPLLLAFSHKELMGHFRP